MKNHRDWRAKRLLPLQVHKNIPPKGYEIKNVDASISV